jgi:hypothetical protein
MTAFGIRSRRGATVSVDIDFSDDPHVAGLTMLLDELDAVEQQARATAQLYRDGRMPREAMERAMQATNNKLDQLHALRLRLQDGIASEGTA